MTSVLYPTVVGASERLDVTTDACEWLDEAKLLRLAQLEFGSAASTAPNLRLEFLCADKNVTIRLGNTKTGVRVERAINDACCSNAEAERFLALLSIGLFRAAKSVLTSRHAAPTGSADHGEVAGNGKPAATSPPPADASASRAEKTPGAPSSSTTPTTPPWVLTTNVPTPDTTTGSSSFLHQLGVVGRTRVHNPSLNAVVTSGVALRYRAQPWQRVSLGGNVEANFGSTEREGGDVDLRTLSLGALAGWRAFESKRFGVTTSLAAGVSVVTIEGASNDEEIGSAAVTGATAYARLLITPTLRTGHVEFGLPLELGYLFRAPRGEVLDEDPVQLDGVSAGLGLAVSFGWSARANSPRTAIHRGARP